MKSLVEAAKRYLGAFYLWGGYQDTELDCSGMVQRSICECVPKFPKAKMQAVRLYHYLLDNGYCHVVSDIRENDVLFFGKDEASISHCAIAVNPHVMIEAAFGGRDTLTKEDALKQGAFVLATPIKRRKDLSVILRLIN